MGMHAHVVDARPVVAPTVNGAPHRPNLPEAGQSGHRAERADDTGLTIHRAPDTV
jgi:hypothetical protein